MTGVPRACRELLRLSWAASPVKLLVAMVDRMKAEQAHAAEENQRLSRELEAMHARMSASEATAAEITTLRGERDAIRSRVTDMLEQLEALNL